MTSTMHFRVVVVGEPESCLRFCALSAEGKRVSDVNMEPKDSLSGLSRDEWVTHLSVETEPRVVTVELILEIHGPWVWELYGIISPHEYFGRYAGIVMVGDIAQADSLRELARFVEVFDSYGVAPKPAVLIYDSPSRQSRGELCLARQIFIPRFVRIARVDFRTGEGITRSLQWIAAKVVGLSPTTNRRLEDVP